MLIQNIIDITDPSVTALPSQPTTFPVCTSTLLGQMLAISAAIWSAAYRLLSRSIDAATCGLDTSYHR